MSFLSQFLSVFIFPFTGNIPILFFPDQNIILYSSAFSYYFSFLTVPSHSSFLTSSYSSFYHWLELPTSSRTPFSNPGNPPRSLPTLSTLFHCSKHHITLERFFHDFPEDLEMPKTSWKLCFQSKIHQLLNSFIKRSDLFSHMIVYITRAELKLAKSTLKQIYEGAL